MMRVQYLILSGFLILTACEVDRDSSEGEIIDDMYTSDINISGVQQEIDQQYQVFMDMYQQQDFDSLTTIYNENGWLMPPLHEMAKGRGEIKRFLESQVDSGFTRYQFSSLDLTFADSLSAVETGSYRLFRDKRQAEEGNYLAFWRNEGDAWRIYRHVWNPHKTNTDTINSINQ